MCPAIHINSRSWLRSSSTREPSDPPLRVVSPLVHYSLSPPIAEAGRDDGGCSGAKRRLVTRRTVRKKIDEKTIASGGRNTDVGSLNLRNAGDVGPLGAGLHRQHAHLDVESAIETGTRHFYEYSRTEYDSRRPVFTPNAGRPRRRRRTSEDVRTAAASQFSIDSTVVHTRQQRGRCFTTVMILPQVHLRKPCYDFYFL